MKLPPFSRVWPQGSLFDSYYTKVQVRALQLSQNWPNTLDLYSIMLSVKQGDIKYHFLSLLYDLTWDWTQVPRAISEHAIRIKINYYGSSDGFQMEFDHFFLFSVKPRQYISRYISL